MINKEFNLEAEKTLIALLLELGYNWETPEEIYKIDEKLFTDFRPVFKALKENGFSEAWKSIAKGQLIGKEQERNDIENHYYNYLSGGATRESQLNEMKKLLIELKEKAIERENKRLIEEQQGLDEKEASNKRAKYEERKNNIRVWDDDIISLDPIEYILDRIDGKFEEQDKQYLTGLKALDKYIKVSPWQLNVIGARTGMGKSMFALNLAIRNLKAGLWVWYFSFEMGETEVLTRLISCISGVSLSVLSWKITDENIINQISDTAWFINDYREKRQFLFSENPDFNQVISTIRKRAKEYGIKVFYIDYVWLLNWDKSKQKRIEIGDMVIKLKHIAEELKITIFILSQLNRQTNVNDYWERPELIHLSESGVIEQTGSIIMLLYRDFREESEAPETLEVWIKKNRNGRTRDIKLKIKPEIMRITDYEEVKKEAPF